MSTAQTGSGIRVNNNGVIEFPGGRAINRDELGQDLAAQYEQFIHGQEVGVYLHARAKVDDSAHDERSTEIAYRYEFEFDRYAPAYITAPVESRTDDKVSTDHNWHVSGQNKVQTNFYLNTQVPENIANDITAPHTFSPLTLALCAANEDFKTQFCAVFLANPNRDERTAFARAFRQTFREKIDSGTELQAHIDKKEKGDNPKGPKVVFMKSLKTALEADNAQKENAAGALFDAGQNDRILKNTGFLELLWKIFNALRGKVHQTKTFGFATAFFNAKRSTVNPVDTAAADLATS